MEVEVKMTRVWDDVNQLSRDQLMLEVKELRRIIQRHDVLLWDYKVTVNYLLRPRKGKP